MSKVEKQVPPGATNNQNFNLTVVPLKRTYSGNLGWFLSDSSYGELVKAVENMEVGGMLVIKEIKEESRKSDKSPHAYLEYISKAKMDAFKASREDSKQDEV